MIKTFNKIFDGLSAQHAGEYLSRDDKIQVLNNRPLKNRILNHKNSSTALQSSTLESDKHIALLCNDTTNQSVLKYILGNSNDCTVDVLFHGAHKQLGSQSFYKHARSSFLENNIDVRLVKLINDSVNDVKNYLIKHRSLQYLVTDSHNQLINEFLKNQAIQRQINVPIVLVN